MLTKMKCSGVVVVAFMCFVKCASSHSMSFRRPCRDLSPPCLKSSLQTAIPIFANGDPELGLDTLDPYELHDLNMTLSDTITIQFSKGFARGLKTCVVDFARLADNLLESQIHCNLTIRGKYKSSGNLLMFPIEGDGVSTIKCDNLKLHSILKLGSKVKNGRKYLDIKSSTVKHAYDGRVTYFMTNLFKGNDEMSKVVLNFMNSNWKLVAEEFGTPIVEYGVKSIMKNLRRFLDIVPIEELLKF